MPVFLQSGSHPAPFFANPRAAAGGRSSAPPKPRRTERRSGARPARQWRHSKSPPRRNDPIADLIGPSPRIAAVQRVLSEYGYGQIKLSGILDDATSAAIEKFEREHKLPVTGRVSDRLVGDLGAMVGHPLE